MQVEFNENSTRLTVTRDIGDPKFGKDESWFYYRVQQELKRIGYDCVKKLAWKDGHLVANDMYYLRERKGNWFIYYNNHALRFVTEPFDKQGKVVLICEGKLL